jgi:PAS domain S-box-containing protein
VPPHSRPQHTPVTTYNHASAGKLWANRFGNGGDVQEPPGETTTSSAVPFDTHHAIDIRFLFQAVWESAVDAMALSDPNGIVIAVNPAYCHLYGYDQDELVGQSFAVIFPEEYRQQAEEEYRLYFTDHVDPEGVEATVQRRDGEERVVDVRYNFLEHDGQRMAMLSVIRDVTERSRLQQSERTLLREKDHVLLAISHDLQSPLTAVRGHAQLLLRRLRNTDSIDPVRVTEGLEQIVQAATRMTRMIEGLLDATGMQRGERLPLRRTTVDLTGLVRQVVEHYGEPSDRERLVVEADQPVVGRWDESRLSRVVDNLLSNALKYSAGTVTVSVGRVDDAGDAFALLTVTDQGIGIPREEIERVFSPFYRATNIGEDVPGSGIGLAGVRRIVEVHGGIVSAESSEGTGSTFTVRLPLGRVSEPDAGTAPV